MDHTSSDMIDQLASVDLVFVHQNWTVGEAESSLTPEKKGDDKII